MKSSNRISRLANVATYFLIVLTLYVATSPIRVYGEPTATFSGRVIDEYDRGMKNVEIKAYSSEGAFITSTNTSSDGSFTIELPPGQKNILYFSKEGYTKATKTVFSESANVLIDLGEIVLLKSVRVYSSILSLVSAPGEELKLPFTVSNIGEEPEVVEFFVTKPEDWSTRILGQIGEVTKINLLGGEILNLQLEVEIPLTSTGNNSISLITAGKTRSTLNFTVMVEAGEVDFTETKIRCSEPWQVVPPGSTVTFSLSVINNGEDDVYLLYIRNPPLPNENWTASFYSGNKKIRSIGMVALQISVVILSVEVPEDAAPDDYSFRVYADGTHSDASVVLTVTVSSASRKIGLLCPFQSKTALMGQGLSYSIKVVNEGEQTEKIFLAVNRTSEMMIWDISFSKNELTLRPKGEEWVTLNVKSPGIVQAGVYSMNVTASTEDGELNEIIPIVAEIVANYVLEIVDIQPLNPQVASGEKIDIIVTVRNMGESPVTKIRLNVSSIAISNIFTTPVDVLALEPMSSVSYYVTISPDIRLTPGDYLIEVQAESAETQSSVRALVISVVSPIPWFWISICITIIATSLAVIAIERLISKYGIRIRIRR